MTDWGPEGYCSGCNRIEPLTADGERIALHSCGAGMSMINCPGSTMPPTSVVPFESEGHAFRDTPELPCKLLGNHKGHEWTARGLCYWCNGLGPHSS